MSTLAVGTYNAGNLCSGPPGEIRITTTPAPDYCETVVDKKHRTGSKLELATVAAIASCIG